MKAYHYFLSFVYCFFLVSSSFAQGSSEYAGGYKIKFNDSGSKYLRLISWGQFWMHVQDNSKNSEKKDVELSVRRARILSFIQLNKKFLILTHFGLNSLNADNLSTTGKGASAQLFFHDFWLDFTIYKSHHVGAGLHYWNGISRLNNQSTLNFLTLDNNRQSWATLGLTDQFVRHIGVFFKGSFGRLQYRVSINDAEKNNLQAGVEPATIGENTAVYAGRRLLGPEKAGFAYAGYFDYNFLDKESLLVPYKVGTYIGSKKVFNVGAGFFVHPNGSVIRKEGDLVGQDVAIFAVDAFYDAPLGPKNAAITAYLVYQNQNYGKNYNLSNTYTTGSMIYSHVGYLIPGDKDKVRLQPYASFNFRTLEGSDDNITRFGVGSNIFLTGHHSKISIEYNSSTVKNVSSGGFTIQAMIYL